MEKCIYCNCGTEDDSIFCTSCGRELPKQKKCIKCGKSIDEDCDWCTHCGAKQTIEIRKSQNIQSEKSKKIVYIISILFAICLIGSGIFFFGGKQLSEWNAEQASRLAADSIRVADSIAAIEAYNAEQAAAAGNNGTVCHEPWCGGEVVTAVVASASNTLGNQGSNSYQASNLLDGDDNTVWATHFTGNEEILTFHINANGLYKISLMNGYKKSEESFLNNSRAKDIRVYVDGTLASQDEFSGENSAFPDWIMFQKEYNNVQEVKIVISSVHQGNKWNDLCVSDVCFFTKE